MTQKKQYYVAGHTAHGFVNYLSTNIENINKIYGIHHVSHTYETAIFNKLIETLSPNFDVEIILSPFGKDYLEGIIIRKQSLAIVTQRLVQENMQHIPITLGDNNTEQYATIRQKCDQLYDQAYEYISQGLAIHDDLEKVYIDEMDFAKADKITDTFVQDLLKNYPTLEQAVDVQKYHRLLGTNTAEGPVNIVPQLIQNIEHRVYIKGRAGTGKSVFMKKVAQACEEKGLDLELYHCSFDPNSIDMVIVPALNFCIFDSTAPHAFAPERDTDITIDLYEQTVTPGTDEKYSTAIQDISKRYKNELAKGTQLLKEAALNQATIEQKYVHIDHKEIEQIEKNILAEIEYQ